ncbi:MAG TPA: terminase small subunit, partial [Draconibacterium sp.]|nr:terminase small subunit [Draconibacterium sp.]
QAAISAGFSEKTAYSAGQRLLKNVEVAEKIAEIQEEERKKAEVSREEILSVLASIIRADVPDFVGSDGKLKSMDSLSRKDKKAIESIKIGRKGVLTLKLSSKLQAVTILNRMLGYDSPKDININFDKLSEDQLDQIISELTKKVSND